MTTRPAEGRDSGGGPVAVSGRRPAVGDVVAGKYRLERAIGEGGMGFVMSARHVELDELFAVKFIEERPSEAPIATARFFREAKATLRLKNEHVVRVFDASAGEGDGYPYIVMEYLDGEDLSQLLRRSGPLAAGTAVDYVLQACEAIAEAHAAGIIHRDLKPSNLFLTIRPDGRPLVKVLDFGISKGPHDDIAAGTLTETGAVFGSPAYMSPEQMRATKTVDHRSDVWSLGVVLFELLSGAAPFDASSRMGLTIAIATEPPRSLRSVAPSVPEELEAIVLACLEKDRDLRLPSIAELARRLEPFATPLGAPSCAIVARMGAPIAPSSSRNSLPSAIPSTPLGFAKTEPGAPYTVEPRARRTAGLVAFLAALAAVAAFAGTRAVNRASSASASTPPPPAAEASPARAVAAEPRRESAPSPPPPAAVAEPAARPRDVPRGSAPARQAQAPLPTPARTPDAGARAHVAAPAPHDPSPVVTTPVPASDPQLGSRY